MNDDGVIRLNLKTPNWSDSYTIARQINQTPSLNPYLQEASMFAEAEPPQPVAWAVDSGQVRVEVPPRYRHQLTAYIHNILEVPVSVNRPATISINRAKNTIVITGDVRVNNATISVQDKTVTVRPETMEDPAAYILENETPRNLVEVDGPGSFADLQGLIDTLNAMGLTTEQVIIVFEELRTAGAIRAELLDN
ncbi:MAG: flagellar basal body P-ring protein FlgI [Planctomycetes bacterium]|nr:flagellar basal body P-ring protein FlgI [Planctomycetota bacterium]